LITPEEKVIAPSESLEIPSMHEDPTTNPFDREVSLANEVVDGPGTNAQNTGGFLDAEEEFVRFGRS